MRILIVSLFCFICSIQAESQPAVIDSLNNALNKTSNDTLRLVIFSKLGDAQMEVNMDSALFYSRQYLLMAQKLNYELNEADAMQQMSEYLVELGSSGNALDQSYKALQLVETGTGQKKVLPPSYLTLMNVSNNVISYSQYRLYVIGKINNMIGMVYSMDKNSKALPYAQKALDIGKSLRADELLVISYALLGRFKNPDSTLAYLKKSYQLAIQTGTVKRIPELSGGIINTYHEIGDHDSELREMRVVLKYCEKERRLLRMGFSYLVFAAYFYRETIIRDSVLYFSMKTFELARNVRSPYLELYACQLLSQLYKELNIIDSAFKYLELRVIAEGKIQSEEKQRQFQNAEFNHQQEQNALENAKNEYQAKVKTYSLLAGLVVFLLVTLILWRNNKNRQKAFESLQKQKTKTDQALVELKSAQAQLIQSEKMASLGELTAGIAHEIQNPLNFVNNFSEVNTELIDELEQEANKGNLDGVRAITKDIKENEQKITYHGKRADAIVKGMLQHSRSSSGQKEPTDVNALADEYLRLAYHGLRAKDHSFNATMRTEFDNTIGKINIIPQDIGRVILNLFTNAFYAVSEKKKQHPNGYEPTVMVSTRKSEGKIMISVKDNGAGIPAHLIDKIFQPFFTTKPTGQGTGLGLSLSYDIVKAHGGELKVKTQEGSGTEFIIYLNQG